MTCSAHSSLLRVLLASVAALGLLLAPGCGGGVDSGGTGSYSSGPISGFGSVIVNGVDFDESGALIADPDGAVASSADLRLGMVVAIEASPLVQGASATTATARRIVATSEVVGPVAFGSGGALSVLGQPVAITPTTVLDARFAGGAAGLVAGQGVAVYGQRDVGQDRIVATRIEPRDAAARYALRAPVEASPAPGLLRLGGLTVSLAGLGPTPQPAPGQVVRVQLDPTPAAGVWVALALDATSRRPAAGHEAQVSGRIDSFASLASFAVDGLPVDARAAQFPDGTAGIALGARVEVEGPAGSDGTIVARSVHLQDDSGASSGGEPFDLRGDVQAYDAAGRRFVLRGLSVGFDAQTRFDNGTAADLRDGLRVRARGALAPDGRSLLASRIELGG